MSRRDEHAAGGMPPVPDTSDLFADVRRLIEETRSKVATAVNVGLTMLYWRIGKRIGQEILKGERAASGKEILATLSQQLVADYGRGLRRKIFVACCNLWRFFRTNELS